jgi:flagellar hook-associated protein 2
MTSSIDGLISGLNTGDLITKLMQVEAQPQTALKNKVRAEQGAVTAYQSVNTKLATLKTTAADMLSTLTWQATKAATNSDAVTATTQPGASPGVTAFDVTRLAKAQVTTVGAGGDGAASSGGGLDISVGGKAPVHVSLTTDTLDGAAAAINAAALGVRASVVNTDSGKLLQFAATKIGAANGFTVSGTANTPVDLVEASDAQISVGDPAHGGYTVSSTTNDFTGVIAGVTFTVSRLQDDVSVTVAPDAAKIVDRMSAMVDAMNASLTEIDKQTAYDPGSHASSPLTGNFAVRQLNQRMLSAVSNGTADGVSYKSIGVGLDTNGKLTFDRDVFLAAYAADPATTQTTLTGGLGKSLSDLAKGATNSVDGTITLSIRSRNDSIRTLNGNIASWDVRLNSRKAALQTQYAHLEVALGKLKDQSSWLSGQIASLPSNG